MKKIFFVVFITLLFSVLCFAKEDAGFTEDEHEPLVKEIKSQTTKQETTVVGSMTFKGTISSITEPGVAQGLKYEITAVDDKGNERTFSLIPGLSIMDYNAQIIPIKGLRPGDKIIVEYVISKSGVNRAMSIVLQ